MSQQRNRIDPASREPLEGLLAAIPGGFNSIADIEQRRAVVGQLLVEPELDKNVTMDDRLIRGPAGEHRIRIYTARKSTKPAPALVYIHGGGMILGSIEGEAATAQMFCTETGATVISVDYRKAPEFPYPCGPDDCYSAAKWVFDNASELGIDSKNIGIYGGSAGGGLALAVSSAQRAAATPDIPTVAEAGYPAFQAVAWIGLVAPAKTPEHVIKKLSEISMSALREKEFAAKLAALGAVPVGNTPGEFRSFIEQELKRWAVAVKLSGAKVD